MKRIPIALFVLAAAAPARAEVLVLDNDKTVAIDCAKDKEVGLLGNNITATLRGTCEKVTVTGNHATVSGSATAFFVAGNHNVVRIDAATSVTVAGNDNTVTYKTKPKEVGNLGNRNSIKPEKAEAPPK